MIGSSTVEGGTAAFLARGRREQKVRFVREPQGIVRKLVPRDHVEAHQSAAWPFAREATIRETESQAACCTFAHSAL